MESSKLIELLKTFTKTEIKLLADFLNSPYFNKSKEVISFFNYLKRFAPHFPLKRIERETVYKALYGDRTYNEFHLNRVMSNLLKQAERFIGQQKYESTKGVASYYVLSSFIDRDLNKHFEYNFKCSQEKLEQSPQRNADYYYQKYLFADTISQQFFKKKIRQYDHSLQDTSDYFDIYFLSKKLIYTCEMINRNKIISTAYKPQFLEEVQQLLTKFPLESVPIIHIYYNILLMLIEKDGTSHFQELKRLLEQYESYFLPDEKREMFGLALNYSIRRLNLGHQQFLEESFNLCRYGIKKGLLNDQNYLSPWGYKNVIKLGLMLNEYEWVKRFIETQTNELAPNFQQNALHFNLADLYYATKDFDQAVHHLNQVEYSDIYINIDSKKLLMKIYYESNEHDALYSALAAFKQFISRNKILSNKVKLQFKNYIYCLNLLLKIETKSLEECKKFLESEEPIAERNWLKRIANEL